MTISKFISSDTQAAINAPISSRFICTIIKSIYHLLIEENSHDKNLQKKFTWGILT